MAPSSARPPPASSVLSPSAPAPTGTSAWRRGCEEAGWAQGAARGSAGTQKCLVHPEPWTAVPRRPSSTKHPDSPRSTLGHSKNPGGSSSLSNSPPSRACTRDRVRASWCSLHPEPPPRRTSSPRQRCMGTHVLGTAPAKTCALYQLAIDLEKFMALASHGTFTRKRSFPQMM